jgi:hypothetical protein
MIPPKIAGPLAIVLGIALCGLALYVSKDQGVVKLFPSLAGPAIIILGIGLIAIPEQKMFPVIGIDPSGKSIYDYKKPLPNSPMTVLVVVGLICGGAFTALIYFGIV